MISSPLLNQEIDNVTSEPFGKCAGTGYLGKGLLSKTLRKGVILGALGEDKEATLAYPVY